MTALALAIPAFGATSTPRSVKGAAVGGYGSPVVIIKPKKAKPRASLQGGKSAGGGGGAPVRSGTQPVPRKGGLPFTGAQLGFFTVVGLALVGSGVLLRLTARKRPSSPSRRI